MEANDVAVSANICTSRVPRKVQSISDRLFLHQKAESEMTCASVREKQLPIAAVIRFC